MCRGSGNVLMRASVVVALLARLIWSSLFLCLVVWMWYPRDLKCLCLSPCGGMSGCLCSCGCVVHGVDVSWLTFYPT